MQRNDRHSKEPACFEDHADRKCKAAGPAGFLMSLEGSGLRQRRETFELSGKTLSDEKIDCGSESMFIQSTMCIVQSYHDSMLSLYYPSQGPV